MWFDEIFPQNIFSIVKNGSLFTEKSFFNIYNNFEDVFFESLRWRALRN